MWVPSMTAPINTANTPQLCVKLSWNEVVSCNEPFKAGVQDIQSRTYILDGNNLNPVAWLRV